MYKKESKKESKRDLIAKNKRNQYSPETTETNIRRKPIFAGFWCLQEIKDNNTELPGMLRSQSGEGFDAEQKKKGRGLMEKSSSVPFNMHSEIDVRRWESLGTHAINMEGQCVIKNSASATVKLQVLMTAKHGELCMYFEQLLQGISSKFRLVNLHIKNLVVMYSMRDPNSFYIATPWKGSFEVSIYCTPDARSINSWLLTLQHMGAGMDVFKEKCEGLLPTVCESSEFSSSKKKVFVHHSIFK
jgi:hypothetical protein